MLHDALLGYRVKNKIFLGMHLGFSAQTATSALDYSKPGESNGAFVIVIAMDIAKTVIKMLPLLCIDSDQLNFMQPSLATRCVFHHNETQHKMT